MKTTTKICFNISLKCSSYCKGSLQVTLNYGCQLIYICSFIIYIKMPYILKWF